ncbi:MAG: hypothetical protein KGJ41_13820 [Rhodospirillales bacterium]|nr:hypothetical protein [Rhodospirillales bacterium]MDE2200089.1 hypothetical protein [Rhodospirillales bacterium]MDE2576963.1 hypothetical protein [Rhodospirillales bacterium]
MRLRLAVLLGVAALSGCARPAPPPPPPPPAPLAPAPIPPAHVSDLIGNRPDQVVAELGMPALRRPDGDAEVWLYAHANGCHVDLVFYSDSTGPKVAHVDTNTPPRMRESDCLQAIAAAAPR